MYLQREYVNIYGPVRMECLTSSVRPRLITTGMTSGSPRPHEGY